MPEHIHLSNYIARFASSPLARWTNLAPWQLTSQSSELVRQLLADLPAREFIIAEEVAIHRSATVESGAILKGPLILGAECFVAAGAYLRGGSWVAENCIFGPGAELKSSFVFAGTKLAHFNFVGDSLLGERVNLEAGSIICNYRNEREVKEVLVRLGSELHRTGSTKFGALVGDGSRVGANSVIAPGALLLPDTVIRRTELCDQEVFAVSGHG
jgi:NDP-sugar pyrophosphorylase family protein